MDANKRTNEDLAALARHLKARRTAILQCWRALVQADPNLSTPSSLSRAQFRDHVPKVLAALEASLLAGHEAAAAVAEEHAAKGADHGMHRWQQGYNLQEVMREWTHLHLCLVDELENYVNDNPNADRDALATARRALARLCCEGMIESTSQFMRMQQTEAAGQVTDLEQAIAASRDFQLRQAELLRGAAHDLRGNLGIVSSAAAALGRPEMASDVRTQLSSMVQKAIGAQQDLLRDLSDLARLQAGQEHRHVEPMDAANLLRDLCASCRQIAEEHRLFIKAVGPGTMPIEGDGMKIRRIAQNLLLNAIKYTERGGVTLSWGFSDENAKQWVLCVEDTGPGLHGGPTGPLAGALQEATAQAHAITAATELPKQTDQANHPVTGEGIGLSIVKRLCELLDATLEVESRPSGGTLFRVLFPRLYEKSAS